MFDFFKKHKDKTYYWISVIALFFYIILTAKASFLSGRMGWEDESHFWTIVQTCSIKQIFSLMRVEGHMLIWYLVCMPFAKLNFPYPYTMQVINWLFCTTAVFIMWKKAPFNYLIKAGIILSPVIFDLYSVHARCYSIGAMFIFWACSLYKNRMKHPYAYFCLLFLAANTSLPAAIMATAMGMPFLYDLITDYLKTKHDVRPLITVLISTFLTGVMFYFQFRHAQVADYEIIQDKTFIKENVISLFLGIKKLENIANMFFIRLCEARLFLILFTVLIATRIRAFIIYLLSFGTGALFFMTVYSPRIWHTAFFLIYLIAVYWIFVEEKPSKNVGISMTFLMVMLFITLFSLRIEPPVCDNFLKIIEQDEVISNGKIFTDIPPIVVSVALPDLNKKNIYIYDMHNRNISYYEGLITYFDKKAKDYNPEDFIKHIENTKENFYLSFIPTKPDKFKGLILENYAEGTNANRHINIYRIIKK